MLPTCVGILDGKMRTHVVYSQPALSWLRSNFGLRASAFVRLTHVSKAKVNGADDIDKRTIYIEMSNGGRIPMYPRLNPPKPESRTYWTVNRVSTVVMSWLPFHSFCMGYDSK